MSGGASRCRDSGCIAADLVRRIGGRLTELPAHLGAEVTGNLVLFSQSLDLVKRIQSERLLATTGRVR